MRTKSLHLLAVIALLAAAALACSTLSGGPSPRDLERTAEAVQGEAESVEAQAEETADAAEATADAALGDDNSNDDANDNSGDDNSNENASNENDNGNGDVVMSETLEDIPLLGGENEVLVDQEQTVVYLADADYDEAVEFYRTEMPNNGWEAVPNGEFELGPLTTMNYQQDGRTATIAVTTDPTSDRTMVTINILEQ
jgi:hypothetical protein